MGRQVDNLIALRILKMLVTPITDTEAFKLGIVDAEGRNLRKASTLKTTAEKDAYSYLTRLVFNMKRIINRFGGESKLKSLAAALWLIREQYESNNRSTALLEDKFASLMKMMDNRVSLVEEEIIVSKFLDEEGEGGAPTNNTSGASVSEPKIYPKDVKKCKAGQGLTLAAMVRRPKPVVK